MKTQVENRLREVEEFKMRDKYAKLYDKYMDFYIRGLTNHDKCIHIPTSEYEELKVNRIIDDKVRVESIEYKTTILKIIDFRR